jgi:hypothetical protein
VEAGKQICKYASKAAIILTEAKALHIQQEFHCTSLYFSTVVYMVLMLSGHPVIQTVLEISDKNITKECKRFFISNACSQCSACVVWLNNLLRQEPQKGRLFMSFNRRK